MDNAEWQQWVEDLVDAKACLGNAWLGLSEGETAAEGVESAFIAALSSIDAVFSIERADPAHQDVATPFAIEAYWTVHRSLPGFALGK